MAQCAQCMFENEPGAPSCEQCGADLAVEALSMQLGEVCRSCDSYNDPGVRVCNSCGQPLGATVEEEPAEPVTEPPTPARPWMASPETPIEVPKISPPSAPPPMRPQVVSSPPLATPAPSALPPGALPPGWTGPAPRAQGPAGGQCSRCGAENLATARFCGNCGNALAAQATRARGKLIVIRGVTGEGRQFPLSGGATSAGRGEAAVSFPDDPYVSAQHATFLFRGDDLVVKDEGAQNGVYVRLREPTALKTGDMFVVGERILRFAGLQSVVAKNATQHGSPRAAEKLLVLEEVLEGGGVGRVCKRAGPVVTIGRAGCDLNFPQDGFVSARHAELSLAGETAFLRDLGSANGTFLRVPPRAERGLHHGDYLLMGRELLRVEVSQAR